MTSRDERALADAGCIQRIRIPLLERPDARQLFLMHVLNGSTEQDDAFASHANGASKLDETFFEIIALCNGFPLSLKV